MSHKQTLSENSTPSSGKNVITVYLAYSFQIQPNKKVIEKCWYFLETSSFSQNIDLHICKNCAEDILHVSIPSFPRVKWKTRKLF